MNASDEAGTMVRLITHNLLACHAKDCTSNNFPLILRDVQIKLREADYNADFLRGFLPRIDWPALVTAAKQASFEAMPNRYKPFAAWR